MSDAIDHPLHYGGKDNPYEAIKVIEAWSLGFNLGNCVKYISRAGKKPEVDVVEDLRKAIWYLDREIQLHVGNDHLLRVGHICICGHTRGAHSSKTGACQACKCIGFQVEGAKL